MTRPSLYTPAGETAPLHRHLNDLVSLTALPAAWAGAAPAQVVEGLIDALHGLLGLDFAYVRLGEATSESTPVVPVEVTRCETPDGRRATGREVGGLLERALGDATRSWPSDASLVAWGTPYRVACARFGIAGELGIVTVGCRRGDFPTPAERVLLDVAVNQGTVGLQHARILAAQRRLADELDARVAERTRELVVANAALRAEIAERARAEYGLHRVENNLMRAVESFPGLVVTMSLTGDVEYINQEVLDYFGRSAEELRNWAFSDAVHPDDLPMVIEVRNRFIENGQAYSMEHRCRRHDGVYRWFQIRAHPVHDGQGLITGWYVLLTDIDERKRAEHAVAESERMLKLTIDTIPALAWSALPDGRSDFFNQHYLDFVGLTAEEASGWGWMRAVHPDDVELVTAAWHRMVTSGSTGDVEARIRRRDGRYCWFLFRASPLRNERGEIVRWYGVNTDIDDRKRMEDTVRENETFLRDVQRLTRVGGWALDLRTGIVANTEEIHRVYDVRPGDDVSRADFWFERIHPEDRPRVREEFERCLRERAEYSAAYRIVRPDGIVAYQRAMGRPVLDEDGALVRFIGVSIDMTEEWRATTELERASEALRELQARLSRAVQGATVGQFAASVAHEVNQPLAGITTNAGTCLHMLDADPPDLDGARETARRTLRDADRAAEVVRRLRDLFGRQELSFEPVDLNEAIAEVVALTLNDLQRHRIVLRQELAEPLARVSGARVQLQQVVLNLLTNAVESMEEVEDRPRELTVRTTPQDGRRVVVTVRDTGVGVDPASVERLFESFHTTKPRGMGMGLSVSRSIIERHRGRLWAEANDGPGATFGFWIPCHEAS